MKKFVSTSIIILALYCSSFSQLIDDFSDGDYINSPFWNDPSGHFVISDQCLKLNSPGAGGISFITTHCHYILNASWELNVRLDFNPSNNNYTDIYLMSDDNDLNGHILGYFVRIGGYYDEISLYRRNGYKDQIIKIIDGENDITDRESVRIQLKVTRDSSGEWKLFYSESEILAYVKQGEVKDTTYQMANFFGIYCQYTSTRTDRFYFDDIHITGEQIIDQSSPDIDTVYCTGPGRVECILNEKIKAESAADLLNYRIVDVGIPDSVYYDPDRLIINVYFHDKLIPGHYYNLIFPAIRDLSDNLLLKNTISFVYNEIILAYAGAVIINEILADPFPVINLPAEEFIELYNTTDQYISLSGCSLNNKSMGNSMIAPKGYCLLCKKDALSAFSPYRCPVVGLDDWDWINNEGDKIILKNPDGDALDSLSFTNDWYRDDVKKQGGWSLELINFNYRCWGEKSWISAVATEGGTPGSNNSVFAPGVFNNSRGIFDYRASGNQLTLEFSDPITETASPGNFRVDDHKILITGISSAGSENTIITFHDNLIPGLPYTLSVNGLEDCSRSYIIDTLIQFGEGKSPGFVDLLITEIMADENPVRGLPESEYLELYNPTDKIIDLSGCQLLIGYDTLLLPDKCLLPHEFRVLCPDGFEDIFLNRAIGISRFPAINNSGEKIKILSSRGDWVFYLDFNQNWFQGGFPGGISMEMIDTRNPCGSANNWGLSSGLKGGTPGIINSITSPNPDNLGPRLESVSAISNQQLLLKFSEPVHAKYIEPQYFKVNDKTIVNKYDILDLENIICSLFEPLRPDIIYKFEINNIMDCAGNLLLEDRPYEFGLPMPAENQDVIINEILFNPAPGGVDYVEILNKSKKFINIDQWSISDNSDTLGAGKYMISTLPFILPPGSIAAFTTDKLRTFNDYPHSMHGRIFQVNKLPSMNDEEGWVFLFSEERMIIDSLSYSENLHSRFLNSVDGVSLERVNPFEVSDFSNNWHSASEQSGFGTPGEKNSTIAEDSMKFTNIYVSPKVFSPDNSGIFDKVYIYYNFQKPGFVANMEICDINGRLVRELANNELLSASGYFTWDGVCDNGKKASLGYYIILMEIFNDAGDYKKIKSKVAIGMNF